MKRTFGIIFLGLGILIIGYALVSSYGIFTGEKDPPQLFQVMDEGEQDTRSQTTEDQMFQEALGNILPENAIPNLLNLIAWAIFAGILLFGGSQVSGIGIRLIAS